MKVAAAWNQLANGAAGEIQRVYDQSAKGPDRDDGAHPRVEEVIIQTGELASVLGNVIIVTRRRRQLARPAADQSEGGEWSTLLCNGRVRSCV